MIYASQVLEKGAHLYVMGYDSNSSDWSAIVFT